MSKRRNDRRPWVLCLAIAGVLCSAVSGDETPHWAWQPLVRPAIPSGTGNPIDAFILAKLLEHGMQPSPQADRRTLIRRVTFNLTGLPPSPEAVDAFVADTRPDAYERLVDSLLESPAYGERWARHWMDVAHFAETHGHDQDRPRPNAWPYRDYLIQSFNQDKSYAQFIREQIAGDVLYPDDPQATVALGFLAAGPWDESSQMGIQDGTTDKLIGQILDRDDMLQNAVGTINSVTIHCARCHDHKFDPISLKDYYALQAVFAGVDRAERAYDPDPALHAKRRELALRKKQIEAAETPLAVGSELWHDVEQWERSLPSKSDLWFVAKPATMTSEHGSNGIAQPDGSILYTGARPDKETYTFTFPAELKGITAIKLEVLAYPGLPQGGPGRQDNGNLHLSEFEVYELDSSSAEPRAVSIRQAVADFNQNGWTIEHAVDGNPATAWGIFPAVGKSHEAVFILDRPLQAASFRVALKQWHGGGHLIGRPRLSVTTSSEPAKAQPLPGALAAILEIPPDQRTDAQRAELARYVAWLKLEGEIATLPSPQRVYAVATDFAPDGNFKPARGVRPVSVLRRGDIHQPIEPAQPGALSCLPDLPSRFDLKSTSDEAERRAALAHWLAHPENALTWRSIVNRVWHYHFGWGIVDTPNDFGRMGGKPSHPQLLDWLAVEFRDGGGSLKKLHRLIVTSQTYKQNSGSGYLPDKMDNGRDARSTDTRSTLDADNRLLWRFNRQRLDAEQVRDAVLTLSGKLDRTMGGPSVKQFIQTPGVHVTPVVDYQAFDAEDAANHRRAVYRFLFRTLPDPFMETLDCPTGSQVTPVRSDSVTPLQALSMMNNAFMVRQAQHAAERLSRHAADTPDRVRALYHLALQREATETEIEQLSAYAEAHGLAAACRLLMNTNEFMFLD